MMVNNRQEGAASFDQQGTSMQQGKRGGVGLASLVSRTGQLRRGNSRARERQRGQREQLAGSSLRWPRVGVNTAAASDAWAIHPMEDAAA
ncbi:hypothetical protein ACJRO7_029881 [Eucalyptus globulus]|uniref:Uncharacterized protein n=1 Tax=Eucalyptus globulus TaxID=34317 RepID=A0ABD3JMH9_EUCGL